MKLIVQIPCYNEEQTLPETVNDIPRKIDGVDQVEILIIDDGSTDRTVEVAKEIGVDHIVRNICNKGLARTFLAGLDACLRLGADIIVNTDGDNQYKGEDIPKLIEPILKGEADIVIGDRQTEKVLHFSPLKKKLQKVGSWVIRCLSETDVPDAVSGFRAFRREAAMQMNIVSPFSYTIETIIQAGKKHLAVKSVPIGTNPKTRESRLFKSIPKFIERSLTTMIRMYTMYQPLRVFFYIGFFFILAGLIPSVRFLIYYFMGQGGGHIQSLIFAAILFIVGFQVLVVGLVADVISFNRRLIEETLLRVRRMEFDHLNSINKK
ncbi:MAG: glycosyltransferase family 2 protein [Proteobacteria bacterium]|nr:glycosyltransferase family 2 protein [Pseudomonadota bacterium]MBU4259990.1 glycosyltransferase family 2 protein [Pseudomonadota bacterium]MBU4287829.1 glycosyltransferase family 2 protein [Pseudomonadota bacterium]